MNFALIENSHRLQKVLAALSDGYRHSTLNLNAAAQVTSSGTAIAEINRNEGYFIEKRIRSDRAAEYRIARAPKPKVAA